MLSDKDGKVIMINREGERLGYKNYKCNDLCKLQSHIKFFDMDGNDIPFDKMPRSRALKGEPVKNYKMMISKYGKEYFVDNSAIPVYDEYGKLNMVISCFHDITESVLQSKKIEEQKIELHAIIENMSEGITILDDKGRHKLFNKAAQEIFLNNKEFYMDDEVEIYGDDGEKVDIENYPSKRIIRGEKFKNVGLTLKFPNNTLKVDSSGTPIYNKEGEFLFGISYWKDMTSHYKQQEMLRNRNEFLSRLIYNLELPVIGLACKDLRILKINQKAFNTIKRYRPDIESAAKMKGNKITDIVTNFEETEYFQKINEVKKEKKTKHLKKMRNFINGNEVYWNLIFEPICEVNGEIKEILVLIIDITAEVKSSIVMEKTLKSQEEFLANISHELKTPLNVIFATAQLLNMYCIGSSLEEKKEFIIKYIDSIKQNSYRLSKLINNIVDLSKIEAGFFELKLANKNIVEVVEEIVMSVTNFTEVKGINIIFDTNTEEKVIACDAEKIERIILNLLSNAIKFSNKGDEIFVEVRDNDEFVEISVKDNGIGIEPSDLNKIFDRFKQVDKSLSRNSEGTGIGLSLVKSFVELHGGSIKVKSKFGYGSKFIVTLPSRNVIEDSVLCNSNIRNKNESIQVEFSDVYS
jgi:signal transduction histidine kinase